LVDSQLAGNALTGDGRLALTGERVHDVALDLALAGNRVRLAGAWGQRGDRLQLDLDAPRLGALGLNVAGRAGAELALTGTFAEPAGAFSFFADRLLLPGGARVAGADGEGRLEGGVDGRFRGHGGPAGGGGTAGGRAGAS